MTTVLAVVLVASALVLLATLLRFSMGSALRLRGAGARLRAPEREVVERLTGVAIPVEAEHFYRSSPRAEERGRSFRDQRTGDLWEVEELIPLTGRDAAEWRAISACPGVPLARQPDKGVYYLAADGTVRVWGSARAHDVVVSASFDAFVASLEA